MDTVYQWRWKGTGVVFGVNPEETSTFAMMMAVEYALHGQDVYVFTNDPLRWQGRVVQRWPQLGDVKAGDIHVYRTNPGHSPHGHVFDLSRNLPLPQLVVFDDDVMWVQIVNEVSIPKMDRPILLTRQVRQSVNPFRALPVFVQYSVDAAVQVFQGSSRLHKHREIPILPDEIPLVDWS